MWLNNRRQLLLAGWIVNNFNFKMEREFNVATILIFRHILCGYRLIISVHLYWNAWNFVLRLVSWTGKIGLILHCLIERKLNSHFFQTFGVWPFQAVLLFQETLNTPLRESLRWPKKQRDAGVRYSWTDIPVLEVIALRAIDAI